MKTTVIKFGLIAGAILSLAMLVTIPLQVESGFENSELVGYTTMVLAFLLVYFGIRSYRDKVADGTVSFGRGLVVGLLIMLIASVCYSLTWQVARNTIAPDFNEKYIAHVVDKAKKSGATEAQIAAQKKEISEFMEMYKNPLISFALTCLEPLPVGLLFALGSAWALSRKRVRPEKLEP